jgi:enterochelin esterase-like enzyme
MCIRDRPYQVYLPPCFFESGRRYPYVLLLHDENKTGKQWLELDLITTLESGLNAQPPLLAPLVLILPSGGDLAASAEFPLGQSYEDVLRTELIPELESTLCLWTNQRMIGGLGRGGFWAYSIALRHPNEFAAVGGHSPDFNPTNAPNSHNPLALAESAQGIERLRMYLDNAQNDRAGANLILFSNLLRERAIEHRYVIQPQSERGAAYWRQYLPAYLAFYSQGLPLSPAELPSCQS